MLCPYCKLDDVNGEAMVFHCQRDLILYVARKDREANSTCQAPVLDAGTHNLDWATLGRKR